MVEAILVVSGFVPNEKGVGVFVLLAFSGTLGTGIIEDCDVDGRAD